MSGPVTVCVGESEVTFTPWPDDAPGRRKWRQAYSVALNGAVRADLVYPNYVAGIWQLVPRFWGQSHHGVTRYQPRRIHTPFPEALTTAAERLVGCREEFPVAVEEAMAVAAARERASELTRKNIARRRVNQIAEGLGWWRERLRAEAAMVAVAQAAAWAEDMPGDDGERHWLGLGAAVEIVGRNLRQFHDAGAEADRRRFRAERGAAPDMLALVYLPGFGPDPDPFD